MLKPKRSRSPSGLLRTFGIASCLTAGTSIAAFACGNALVLHLMFKAWPETKKVSMSERNAIASRLLVVENPPTHSLKLLHMWRTRKLERSRARLSKRLRSVSGASRPRTKASMLLINEFVWLDLEPTTDGVKITNRGIRTPDAGTTLVFTTRRVLDSLLTRTVSWDVAQTTSLLVVNGNDPEKAAWEKQLAVIADQRLAGATQGTTQQRTEAPLRDRAETWSN